MNLGFQLPEKKVLAQRSSHIRFVKAQETRDSSTGSYHPPISQESDISCSPPNVIVMALQRGQDEWYNTNERSEPSVTTRVEHRMARGACTAADAVRLSKNPVVLAKCGRLPSIEKIAKTARLGKSKVEDAADLTIDGTVTENTKTKRAEAHDATLLTSGPLSRP
ncbi:hypothetical protein FA15DRAFT_653305 [Coprinopsis marcescibilis]|uniref:Uncharacterized protein n=1 Tax=Coprinopsis marcescibilis TaxID=230819 RepID=A0A5C3L6P8_COPMA|nr:hypothetical protein FA15DRAFT_653305 [Coprinopsis marcescibilis]